MKTLEQIRSQLQAGEFEYSLHAIERAFKRGVSDAEVREVGGSASLIEENPDNRHGPTWLLLGFTSSGRPLHLVVSIADEPLIKVVTMYEPDPERWRGYTERR